MTTDLSRRNLQTFTGIAVLTLTMFLSACGDSGTDECNGCAEESPIVGNGVVTTFAGDGTAGFLDDSGTAAQFNKPHSVTSDGTNLYIADTENHRIRKIVIATGEVSTLAGNGAQGFLDGTRTAAQFNGPQGITTDGTNLYIADTFNNRIRKIDASGEVTTLAGDGNQGSLDDSGTAAQFNQLHKITSYGMDLYVADYANNSIRKVDMITGQTTTLAILSDVTQGITTDGVNVYVTGFFGRISQIVIATGEVSTLAGGGSPPGYLDGTGSAARFADPQGITIDGTDFYVADSSNHRIRRIQLP